jgi:hypothetical protein
LEVQNEAEGAAIKTAMKDPATRAFVLVMGSLLPLDQAARERVLTFTQSKLASSRQKERDASAREAKRRAK